MRHFKIKKISGQVDRASATEMVDLGSIPGRVKPKLEKLIFTASLLDVQKLKEKCEASIVWGKQEAVWLEDRKVSSLSPSQDNFVNRMVLETFIPACVENASLTGHKIFIGNRECKMPYCCGKPVARNAYCRPEYGRLFLFVFTFFLHKIPMLNQKSVILQPFWFRGLDCPSLNLIASNLALHRKNLNDPV